jgi:hypothetical protein
MLHRPPGKPLKPPASRRVELRRRRDARHRQRQRAGIAVYPVELDGDALQLLIRWHWIDEVDAGNRELIGAAIGARLAELVDYVTRR